MTDERVIQVRGIPDLHRGLRLIDKELAKELATGLAEAADIVLQAAKPLVPVRSGAAVGSMKVRKKQSAAAIAVGGSKAPYFPWLDFGGTVGRGRAKGASAARTAGGGSIRRPYIKGGRYIYPVLARKDAEVRAKVDEVIERLAKKAGFTTAGKGV